MNAATSAALAALVGGDQVSNMLFESPAVITGDGAIDLSETASQIVHLTKGSAAAITIAAPNRAGQQRTIISDTAFAHVVTFTGNTLRGGTAAVATATAAAQKGAGLTVRSLLPSEAAWGVIANVAMTLA